MDEEDTHAVNWRPILVDMYEGGHVTKQDEEEKLRFEIFHPVGADTDLNYLEKQKALRFLENNDFITYNAEVSRFVLTDSGLQIAKDLLDSRRAEQFQTRQSSINLAILLATIILALTAILTEWPPEFFRGTWLANWVITRGVFWIGAFVALAVFVRLIYEYYKLERWSVMLEYFK